MSEKKVPRIDVVVVRDPDYDTAVTVYLDGQEVEVNEWSFDPGAGYEYADYMDMRQSDVEAAPEFLKKKILKLYQDLRRTYAKWGFSWTDEECSGAADEAFLAEISKEKEAAK